MRNRILTGLFGGLPFIGFGIAFFPLGVLFIGVGAFLLYRALAGSGMSSGTPCTESDTSLDSQGDDDCVNPATGLPMIGGIGGLDGGGNSYGFDDD